MWYDSGLPIRDEIGDPVHVSRVRGVSPGWQLVVPWAHQCRDGWISAFMYGPSVSIRSRSGGSTRGECLMSDAVSVAVADAMHEATLLIMPSSKLCIISESMVAHMTETVMSRDRILYRDDFDLDAKPLMPHSGICTEGFRVEWYICMCSCAAHAFRTS